MSAGENEGTIEQKVREEFLHPREVIEKMSEFQARDLFREKKFKDLVLAIDVAAMDKLREVHGNPDSFQMTLCASLVVESSVQAGLDVDKFCTLTTEFFAVLHSDICAKLYPAAAQPTAIDDFEQFEADMFAERVDVTDDRSIVTLAKGKLCEQVAKETEVTIYILNYKNFKRKSTIRLTTSWTREHMPRMVFFPSSRMLAISGILLHRAANGLRR